MSLTPQPQGVRPEIGPAYPARRTSGIGNWDQPKHTTCRGRLIWENPTYSAFWSVFGATCLRLQRLASSVGFGTTAPLGPIDAFAVSIPLRLPAAKAGCSTPKPGIPSPHDQLAQCRSDRIRAESK